MKRNWSVFGLVLMCSMAVIVGCEWPWDDDDDDEVQGTSTIQGYVTSFDAGGVSVSFAPVKQPMLNSLFAGISEILVPSAYAAGIGGVIVKLDTGEETTTDAAGFFVFSGVQAGDRELIFSYRDREVAYPITVQDNARVELKDIRVTSDDTVTVGNVVVTRLDEAPAVAPRRATTTTTTTATTTTTSTTTTTQPHTGGEMPF